MYIVFTITETYSQIKIYTWQHTAMQIHGNMD